jgi:hypothetical protein
MSHFPLAQATQSDSAPHLEENKHGWVFGQCVWQHVTKLLLILRSRQDMAQPVNQAPWPEVDDLDVAG